MAGDGEEKEVKSYCGQVNDVRFPYCTSLIPTVLKVQMDTEPSLMIQQNTI